MDDGGQLMAVVYFTLVRFLRACLADLSGLAELIALILALQATKEAEVLLAGEETAVRAFGSWSKHVNT